MVRLELSNIYKFFGDNKVLHNIDLEVNDGEYFCLVGPSSAGKTTTLKIVAGLYEPTRGKILFDGKDVTALQPWERGAVMMFQNPTLFFNMTVLENIMFPLRVRNIPYRMALEIANGLLETIHLEKRPNAYPNDLSGGMQQRVALARALASGSKLLLLDEPLGALDARLKLELRKELRKFAKDNSLTVIHVTQDQDEAMDIADRIALLKDGRVIQVDTPTKIYNDPKTPFAMDFIERTNFIEAYIENRIDPEMVELTVERIYHRIQALSNSEIGERVLLSVRPSSIRVSRRRGGKLFGRVTWKRNMGSYSIIEAQIFGSDKKVRIETSFKVASRYKLDDIIGLEFSVNNSKVYRYPHEGIIRELEV